MRPPRLDGLLIVRLRVFFLTGGHGHLLLDVAGQGVDHLQDTYGVNMEKHHGKNQGKSWENGKNHGKP